MKKLFKLVILVFVFGSTADAETPPLASNEQVEEALAVFMDWTAAYQNGDYLAQWRLTHPRIRRWHNKKRWKKSMRHGVRKNGTLESFRVIKASPIEATRLPCTEMGHCYRKDMQVVIILLDTTYEKTHPNQPEYVVVANSDEGWRFGGGTFPGLPAGETMVILDRKDESRYAPRIQ